MLDLLRTKLDKALGIMHQEQLNTCLIDGLSTMGDEYTFCFLVLFAEPSSQDNILTEPRLEAISPGLIDIEVARPKGDEFLTLADDWNRKADDNQVRWKSLTSLQVQRLQDSFRAEIHALRLSLDQFTITDVDGSQITDDTLPGLTMKITLGVPRKEVDFGITV